MKIQSRSANSPKLKDINSHQGFTLFEMIIYIAIVGFFLVSAVYIAFAVSTSRSRFIGRAFVYNNAARILNTIDYLVRNADGFVTDSSGTPCVFTNKIWLYFATSSISYVPPLCMGQYASGAVAVQSYASDGTSANTNVTHLYNAAVSGPYLFSVGIDASPNWYIEKRFKDDLSLDSGFDNDGYVSVPSYQARGMAIDNQYIYVVGGNIGSQTNDARIEKRRLDTGALCTAANCGTAFDTDGIIQSPNAEGFYAIVIDSNYMYVIGRKWNEFLTFYQISIEKRRLDTGALCTAGNCGTAFDTDGILILGGFNSNGSDIALDSSGTNLYAVGFINTSRTISKLLASTGAAVSAFGSVGTKAVSSGSFAGVALDSSAVYVTGTVSSNIIIEKYAQSDGAAVTTFGTNGTITLTAGNNGQDLKIDGLYLYTQGSIDGNQWYRDKRLLTTGATVADFAGGSISGTALTLNGYGLTFDTSYIYLIGDAPSKGYIEKRFKSSGALDIRNGVKMLCYQDYPHNGNASSCASDPPSDNVFQMDLSNPFTTFVGNSGSDFKVTTTTAGSKQAFELQMKMGGVASGLIFSPPTITPSTTEAFRISNPY